MTGERQILLATEPVPRWSIRVLSVLGHAGMLALIWLFVYAARPRIVPPKLTAMEAIRGGGRSTVSPAPARLILPRTSPLQLPKIAKAKRTAKRVAAATGEGEGLEALRGRASRATAGLMDDMKFLHTYGFSTQHYELAIHTAGELPTIPASWLPPRYEQYIVVEVTIDTDGKVADARLVSGEATKQIENTLISAIREFKYIPAKRNGAPMPCQVDIVVHIPT